MDISTTNKKLEEFQNSTEALIKKNVEDLLVHMKEETKRRIRDKNDAQGKFSSIGDEIAELSSSNVKNAQNIGYITSVVRSILCKIDNFFIFD